MLKTILELPDGTEISSGAGTVNAIQSVTLTECVNDSAELRLGSTCANAIEVTLFTPAGALALNAGSEVIVHKESAGVRQQVGVFTLEKPTRPSANIMKVTGYDRVSKLDKDLTAWLSGLTEWPYTLTAFAGMVCEACGVTFKESNVPNGDFPVKRFSKTSVTGRQIMQWLGEICCRFCRATPEGEIEFAWYTDSGKTITPHGDMYYFQNSLTYEDYVTAEIDAVQIRLADSANGALWPAVAEEFNRYIITGNAILNIEISEDLLPVLENIKNALADVQYTPCKVSTFCNLDIHAGNTVRITDKNGKAFTAYVMTKTQSGQKDTLECTGSYRRNTTTSANNKTPEEVAAGGVGVIIARGEAILPPTLEDVALISKAYLDPETYPPQDYYDLNGNGRIENNDAVWGMMMATGQKKASDSPVLKPTKVTIRIDPFNPDATVSITGTNMWGSEVSVSFGVTASKIPFIDGDTGISGILSVGKHAIIPAIALDGFSEPKTLSWRDNGDGTYTPVGR